MSELHAQAQYRLQHWLKSQAPEASVDLEISTERRDRRADVMLSRGTSHHAFEIQYSALEYNYFATRSDSYMRQDVAVTWLFGSVGPQLKVGRDGYVRLTKVQKALSSASEPVLWFNPITLQVAVAYDIEYVRAKQVPVFPRGPKARLQIFSLDDCELLESGIRSDVLRKLYDGEAAFRSDLRERAERVRAREAELAAQEAEADARRTRELGQLRSAIVNWQGSSARADLLARYAGRLPDHLTWRIPRRTRPFRGKEVREPRPSIHLPRQQWQAAIWLEHIQGARKSAKLDLDGMIATVDELALAAGVPTDPVEHRGAVLEWLDHLAALKLVQVIRHYVNGSQDPTYYAPRPDRNENVVRDGANFPEWAALYVRSDGTRTDDSAGGAYRRPPWELSRAQREQIRPRKETGYTCVQCGLPLDPILADTGRHILC
ncbi:hypothetical protein ASF30_02135 [Leifsonia sp. Leaf264]|nr:hypothetical protein ASF30_02135 [Leifsonia sp. Leaf264]